MANITDLGNNLDFNYPSLNRRDLMSLSTINNTDNRIRKFKNIDTKRDWSTNLYNLDIDGSVPKKFGVFNHKTDFINKLDDIEKTNSKILHFPLNKLEYNLTNKDIAWASPQTNRNFITTRSTNPMEPKYNLSKVEEIPQIVPRFIRDSINIDGIDGARPKKYFQWETRKMLDNSEIKGSAPKKSYIRNTNYNNIDYSDVTHNKFKTNRCVDPLDPIYEVKYKGEENYTHGKIEGSKPVTFSNYNYIDPLNMKTADIDGSAVGSKNRINKFTGPNYNLMTKDFRGASSGSLKKGIETKRQTNPLNPDYAFPGQTELKSNNNPYGNTLFSKSAKVRSTATEGESNQSKQQVGSNNNKNNNYEKQNSNNLELNRNVNNIQSIETGKSDQRKLLPYEVVGFNNQVYKEEPIEFDPNKYQKPDPYYGFIHDRYIVSSENQGVPCQQPKKENEKKTSLNGASNSKDTLKKTNSDKSVTNLKSTNFTDYSKQTYSQLLDKFIQKNPLLD